MKKQLAEIFPLCWEKLPRKQFEVLWISIPDQVEVAIKAKGWYTRY